MIEWIKTITFTKIIELILGLDTVRVIIAYTGWFCNPKSKAGKVLHRIIYGQYGVHMMSAALQELGYSADSSEAIVENLKDTAASYSRNTVINPENAPEHLIALLSNYIVEFESYIQYGGDHISKSKFYIDTMEIPHNGEDMQKLTELMCQLINSKRKNKPKAIFVPKGGNPFLAKEVAQAMNSKFVVSKAKEDKSRVSVAGLKEHCRSEKINYEGSWDLFDAEEVQDCILLDCNTSGGTQLLRIVSDLQKLIQEDPSVKLQAPKEAYVLFRADIDERMVDQNFSDLGCTLHRYFDLDETAKGKLYELKDKCKQDNRRVSVYYPEDKAKIDAIIDYLKSNKKFYYKMY